MIKDLLAPFGHFTFPHMIARIFFIDALYRNPT
ncbi:MAG: 23S rRNA (pseudouridine(1915)-N(3))-methyltransferase RlmH [bacterium]|nr:23S rRNA (pseudouridine(1915)-N(3))-methyltransferase RlmH [bacterium]